MDIYLQKTSTLPTLHWLDQSCPAILGAGGLCAPADKQEGDGKTPAGTYILRRVLYRQDRIKAPQTILPCRAIRPEDGWCDDPNDPAYNRPVILPYGASAERLFRDDHVYDILVVLGHNDAPPIAGLGSAVFLHLARENGAPTRGCIATGETDLRMMLQRANRTSRLILR